MTKTKKAVPILIILSIVLITATFIFALISNIVVVSSSSGQIKNVAEVALLDIEYDFILVLGAGLRDDGTPSNMLSDRLDFAVSLYESEVCRKILLSGDRSGKGYDEPGAMYEYIVARGVDPDDIIKDDKGFSTYDSVVRAKDIHGGENIIIVTQQYHLYRAIYIANRIGINSRGVPSDPRSYSGQSLRDVREIAARLKDFIATLMH